MSPAVWLLIGIGLGAVGALGGVWFGVRSALAMADRIDAEMLKEDIG